MIVSSTKKVAGLRIIDKPCSKCGSKMYLKPCPCFARKKGWKTCVKCVRCGHLEVIERR